MAEPHWHYSDGKQPAGPVTQDVLRQWLASGELQPGTLVWREGLGGWMPAASVPELATTPTGSTGASLLPPMAVQPLAYHVPPPVAPGQDFGMRVLLPVGRSGWAIAAGYAGLLSPLIIFAPLAILFGILAIRDMRKHPDRHGMGRAIFALVMGTIGVALGAIMLITVVSQR